MPVYRMIAAPHAVVYTAIATAAIGVPLRRNARLMSSLDISDMSLEDPRSD